jgi:hypothetical protein
MIESDYKSCNVQSEPLIRYTAAPTKYDLAPYGTRCILHLNDDGSDRRVYVQISDEESNPQWESAENLVIMAFSPLFENPCFIQECLEKIKTL